MRLLLFLLVSCASAVAHASPFSIPPRGDPGTGDDATGSFAAAARKDWPCAMRERYEGDEWRVKLRFVYGARNTCRLPIGVIDDGITGCVERTVTKSPRDAKNYDLHRVSYAKDGTVERVDSNTGSARYTWTGDVPSFERGGHPSVASDEPNLERAAMLLVSHAAMRCIATQTICARDREQGLAPRGALTYDVAMKAVRREAEALHQQGREAGSAGDPVRALELFNRARELAPDWAYPPYDMAFTYLLHDELEQAERWYAVVDELEPRGFFTSKTSLDTVRRERRGELPAGFARAFAMLDWEPSDRQRIFLQQIVERCPNFAPAWQKLAFLTDDDDTRWQMIERGMAANPDDETWGVLVSNKAMMLGRRGQRAEARRVLLELLADRRCTAATEATTKAFCAGLLSEHDPG